MFDMFLMFGIGISCGDPGDGVSVTREGEDFRYGALVRNMLGSLLKQN